MIHRPDKTPRPQNIPLRDFIDEPMRLRRWNYYSEFAGAVRSDGSVVSRRIRDRKPTPAMTRRMAQRLGADEADLMSETAVRSTVR